jgi:hypothetical protein
VFLTATIWVATATLEFNTPLAYMNTSLKECLVTHYEPLIHDFICEVEALKIEIELKTPQPFFQFLARPMNGHRSAWQLSGKTPEDGAV